MDSSERGFLVRSKPTSLPLPTTRVTSRISRGSGRHPGSIFPIASTFANRDRIVARLPRSAVEQRNLLLVVGGPGLSEKIGQRDVLIRPMGGQVRGMIEIKGQGSNFPQNAKG